MLESSSKQGEFCLRSGQKEVVFSRKSISMGLFMFQMTVSIAFLLIAVLGMFSSFFSTHCSKPTSSSFVITFFKSKSTSLYSSHVLLKISHDLLFSTTKNLMGDRCSSLKICV